MPRGRDHSLARGRGLRGLAVALIVAGLTAIAALPAAGSDAGQRAVAGAVNHNLSFGRGSQASSAIAMQPDDPERAIAATNEAGGPPAAFVSNRGLAAGSVARRYLPAIAEIPGPGSPTEALAACCDPAVAADDAGNLWMAAATSGSGGRIVIARVPAADNDFVPLATGLPVAAGADAGQKPALAVGAGGRIAVAWIETSVQGQNVVYSECDAGAALCDDPDAWSEPATLNGAGRLLSMPSIEISAEGDVYAAWWNRGDANAIAADRCRASEDCADPTSWDEDAKIADLDSFDDDGGGGADPLPLRCPIIAAPGGLVNPSPSIRVGPEGIVYVAYGDLRDNASAVSPSRCTASGTDKTFDTLVSVGPGGGVLPAPNSAVRLSRDEALALNDHFLPALSVDPLTGRAQVSFYSTQGDPGGERAWRVSVTSADGGSSWSAPRMISTDSSRFSGPRSDGIDYGDRHGDDSAAGVYRPAWTDNRPLHSSDPDLYVLSPEVETVIESGPSGTVGAAISTFGFSSRAPRIECAVDAGAYEPCLSPRTVGPLANGAHSFAARATDRAGNPMDTKPAIASWTIADLRPPETTITEQPKKRTTQRRPQLSFVADEVGARFQCRYDAEPWRGCRSPKRAEVTVGRHRFGVRAIDVAGNVDPTAAHARFTRELKCSNKRRRRGRC